MPKTKKQKNGERQATHLDVGTPSSEIHQWKHILRVHTHGVSESGALNLAPYVLVVHGARPIFFLTLNKKEKPTSQKQKNNTRAILVVVCCQKK